VTAFQTPSRAALDLRVTTPPRLSGAEQSNSSLICEERLILKLYRRIQMGMNPDLEISEFLTEVGFPSVAPVAGGLSYRRQKDEVATLGMLQAFVQSDGDAWEHALRELEFGGASAARSYAPFASLLGQRTAEMHRALATDVGNTAFTPEPTTPEYAASAVTEIGALAADALGMLRGQLPRLDAEDQRLGEEVVAGEERLLRRLDDLREHPISAHRIRCHGDYHLGQVLFSGGDFVIVDFEGEPARPLAERRSKRWAMKDVSGMVRSFAYAATSADRVTGARWERAATGAFLASYWAAAGEAPFVPSTGEERDLLMDAMLVEKALYELRYELNNRPDWVGIPLRGLHALLVG
jgi:maltose alpha-D-glucosyltransferase/alpha-amylase